MKFAPIINPDVCRPTPKPVRVDLRKVFLIGTSLWALALIVCTILLFLEFDVLRVLIVCTAGTVIGVAMLIWEQFDRWDYRRLGA